MSTMLGVDVGGSGVKGGIVDLEQGALVGDRYRIKTPQPATPEAVAKVVAEIVSHFEWNEDFGCAVPAIVRHGVAHSAANIDESWIGSDVASMLAEVCGHRVEVLNDADAAGLAEVTYGAGKGHSGVVLLLTFGTGIGSALILDGQLVPNTELGHLQLRGDDAEHWASAKAREDAGLSFKKWGKLVTEYLRHVDFLLSPDLIIIGGGISKEFDEFHRYLDVRPEVVAAQLRNHAGIIGAAVRAVAVRGGNDG